MGNTASSSNYLCGLDVVCGVSPSSRSGTTFDNGEEGLSAMDPDVLVVKQWIAAREAGDALRAAALCHPNFIFTSPQLTLQGRNKAQNRLFSQVAPVPEQILMPLKRAWTGLIYREIAFKVNDQRLAIRQEWTLATGDHGKPMIMSVAASRV